MEIQHTLRRLSSGTGRCETVGDGISELRVDYGPAKVYSEREKSCHLRADGDKSSQCKISQEKGIGKGCKVR